MAYVVMKRFHGGGRDWQPGDRVPAEQAEGWRTLPQLVEQRYLRLAPDALGSGAAKSGRGR